MSCTKVYSRIHSRLIMLRFVFSMPGCQCPVPGCGISLPNDTMGTLVAHLLEVHSVEVMNQVLTRLSKEAEEESVELKRGDDYVKETTFIDDATARAQLLSMGYNQVSIPGDGDCLPRSLMMLCPCRSMKCVCVCVCVWTKWGHLRCFPVMLYMNAHTPHPST